MTNSKVKRLIVYQCYLLVSIMALVSGCNLHDDEPWDEYERSLMKGVKLPREARGGFYTYDTLWVSSVYKDGHLCHYVMGPQYEVQNANLEHLADGTPFQLYCDRSELYSVLYDVIQEVQCKNEQLFYVACQASSDEGPVQVESFEVEYRDPFACSSLVYIDVSERGVSTFLGKEYPSYRDQSLIDELVAFSKKDASCLFILRGAGSLTIEKFINILAYLEAYADLDIYIEKKKYRSN